MKRQQRGDTIIEVLLALAVIGTVVGAAYAAATRSLRGGQASQERSTAVKIVEAQIEKLKYVAADPDNGVFDPSQGTLYCIDESFNRVMFDFSTLPGIDTDDFSRYPDECRGQNNFYNIAIEYKPASDLFSVTARWERSGGGREESLVQYRMYP